MQQRFNCQGLTFNAKPNLVPKQIKSQQVRLKNKIK